MDIWQSTNSVSPAKLFGGTWTQYTDNRFWAPVLTNNTLDPEHQHGSNIISFNQLPKMGGIRDWRVMQWNGWAGVVSFDNLSGYTNPMTSPQDRYSGENDDEMILEGSSTYGAQRDIKFGQGQEYKPKYRTCFSWARTA